MRQTLINAKLINQEDEVYFEKLDISPTNIYNNFYVRVNEDILYFIKEAIDKNDEKMFNQDLKVASDIENLSLSPNVLYSDCSKKIIITKYCNNSTDYIDNLSKIAVKLKEFHTKAPSYGNAIYAYKSTEWFEKYKMLPQKIKNDFKDAYELIYNRTKYYDSTDEIISHNDFHFSNIIIGEDIHLIDFDHMGLNSKYFDLATLSISLNLNKDQEKILLANYEDTYNYSKFQKQKIFSASQYALSCVTLVNYNDCYDADEKYGDVPFSWECKEINKINSSRLRLAYNFLNYQKKLRAVYKIQGDM